jgi:diacylglycerol kinase
MEQIIKKHHISFKNAFSGLKYAFVTQPNFLVHGSISLVVILLGLVVKISKIEMTILLTIIILGLAIEMANTAIESVTDLITSEWRKEAKIAKDVAAGMMLLTAIGATIIALFIFTPYFLANLK